ncbi:MAG TPA: helix-turn-helix domain-containing protein [Candidatus Saccharimonadales bacterium]|nr:helix-turn-helix domain-containing protein [Candidatus Saccharimonadales bacterium]
MTDPGEEALRLPQRVTPSRAVELDQLVTPSGVSREGLDDALATIEKVLLDAGALAAVHAVYSNDMGEIDRVRDLHRHNMDRLVALGSLAAVCFRVSVKEPGALEEMIDPLRGRPPFARWLTQSVDRTGRTQDVIARQLKWSPSKLSRLMRGSLGARQRTMTQAATYFGRLEGHRDEELTGYIARVEGLWLESQERKEPGRS